jgi:hypothetical protein
MRKHLIGELLDRHVVAQGEHGSLDDLATFRGQHLGAEQATALALGHELDEAPDVEIGQRRCRVTTRPTNLSYELISRRINRTSLFGIAVQATRIAC